MKDITLKNKALSLKSQGLSSRKIAKMLGVGKSTVNEWVKQNQKLSEDKIPYKEPRVLFLDIETAPSIALTFGRFKQNISPKNIVQEGGQIISVAWSFLGEETIHSRTMTTAEAWELDDSYICAMLYDLFEQVDVVWGHNGIRFDYPGILTRMLKNGFKPPKTVQVKDTLLIAKKLKFNSNSLQGLAQELGLENKAETGGIELWKKCMNGDPEALLTMQEYNIQDVKLLKQVYHRLKAYDRTPTGMGRYYKDDDEHCPVCGSTELERTGHSVYTDVSEFEEVKCSSCGHRSRTRKAINTKSKRASLLMTPKS